MMEEKDIIEREFRQFKYKQIRNILIAFVAMYATGFNPVIVRSKISDLLLFGTMDLYLIFGMSRDKEENGDGNN